MTEDQSLSGWNLSIPFITAPGLPLTETHNVMVGNRNAELQPHAFGYSKLLIEGLDSAQSARGLFEALRIGFLAASLNIDWGVRVRDVVAILDQDSPMPSEVDMPLIYPTGKSLRRLLFDVGPMQMSINRILPRIQQSLEFGIKAESAKWATGQDRVKVALDLYVNSYFETSESARFLALVTVLEVLKDKGDSSDNAREMIDRWSAETSKLDATEAASIRGSLKYLKWISISRGIGSVVQRHIGDERAKEARDLYTIRSSLMHDGIRPDNFSEIVARAQRLAKELLISILQSGSL